MHRGEKLALWKVVAQNDATDSGNQIHDDEVAARYGFQGGLVPGITLYGYMTGPLVAVFGPAWLDRGGMRVRLRRPVYTGQKVTVHGEVTQLDTGRSEVELVLRNDDGEACAVGTGWMLPTAPDPGPDLPARRSLPETRWPPLRETFERQTVLGSVEARWNAERCDEYLELMQDPNPVYREGVVHPAWILRLANLAVDRNVAVNPWIHVSSDVQNLRRVRADEVLEVRAQVRTLFEKNRHEYADFDVLIAARRDGATPDVGVPVLRATHRAIYRLRQSD